MKKVVCKTCKKELTHRPTDCENKGCPYQEGKEESSFWDLLDAEIEVNNKPVGCLNVLGKSDGGCLGEFGGCLLLPFKWMFQLIIGFFKVVGKILSVFDD